MWEKASCNEKESVVWHKKSFILFNHFLAVDLFFENSTDTLLKVIHNSLHSWNLHQFLHEMLLSANNTTYKIQPYVLIYQVTRNRSKSTTIQTCEQNKSETTTDSNLNVVYWQSQQTTTKPIENQNQFNQ